MKKRWYICVWETGEVRGRRQRKRIEYEKVQQCETDRQTKKRKIVWGWENECVCVSECVCFVCEIGRRREIVFCACKIQKYWDRDGQRDIERDKEWERKRERKKKRDKYIKEDWDRKRVRADGNWERKWDKEREKDIVREI